MIRRFYRTLLRILPSGFRTRHRQEMESVFLDAMEAERAHGIPRMARRLARETLDVTATGLGMRVRGWARALRGVRDDARLAGLSLVRRPAFALFAAGTVALGVGATTAIFSALESVILDPLPYAGGDRLVGLYRTVGGDDSFLVTPDEEHFEAWRTRDDLFEDAARIRTASRNLTGLGDARQVQVAMIEADFLELLGVAPTLGRSFTPEESLGAGGRVALVSNALWREALGGRASALGRTIALDGDPYTVIGVLPPRVPIPPHPTLRMDAFIPFGLTTVRQAQVVARLREGVGPADVAATFARLAEAAEASGESPTLWHGSAQDALAMTGTRVADALRVLMAAVVLLLLISCANVSNLLLSRQTRRERETAVRAALGAGRGRLVREQLLESLALGLAGGLGGLGLAWLAVRAMASLRGEALEVLGLVHLDREVMAFALATSVGASALFGVLPSLRAAGIRATLAGARGAGGGRRDGRARWALLTGEVALSFALLVGATLVIRSLAEMRSRDPGFRAEGLVTLDMDLPEWKYEEGTWRAVDERIESALAGLPGVRAVTRASGAPPSGGVFFGDVEVEGRGEVEGAQLFFGHSVEPDHFEVLGQPVLEGRAFRDDDVPAEVVVLGEAAARRLFPDGGAVGGRIRQDEWRTVVGVVADVAQQGLGFAKPELQMYQLRDFGGGVALLRTTGDIEAVLGAVRREVRALEPDAVIVELASVEAELQATLGRERFTTALLGAFAAVALALSAVGLYGVVSQVVGQRTREIGIRISMGARTSAVARMVLRQGLAAAVAGTALGMALALVGLRALGSQVFGVERPGAGTFAAAAAVIVAVTLAACWVPARRAAAIDPSEALRSE